MCWHRAQIEKLGGVVEAGRALVLTKRDRAGAAATWRRSSIAAGAGIAGIGEGRDVAARLEEVECCKVVPTRKAESAYNLVQVGGGGTPSGGSSRYLKVQGVA